MFEELDPDIANKLFDDMTDEEVAEVIARMRADDAADAIAELDQNRRVKVLDLLPPGSDEGGHPPRVQRHQRRRHHGRGVSRRPGRGHVEEALRRMRLAENVQPEALLTVHAVDQSNRLSGTALVIGLLHAEPETPLSDIMDGSRSGSRPTPTSSTSTILMADYNLMTVPVVDTDDQLLGVITVDDILEATIPEDWRRREPPPHPEPLHARGESELAHSARIRRTPDRPANRTNPRARSPRDNP